MPLPAVRPFVSQTSHFCTGADTPSDFLERCLATITALEPEVKAFVHYDIDRAREAAAASTMRWRAGTALSRIDGMPVGVKDIIETVDMPTQMGSPLYTGWRSERDGASVAALREAGAVVVGKTVTTEFAMSVPGPTRNPWDLRRTPGGSSSGSAAAVGSGMLPAALGTQVLGSILRPASYCGCVAVLETTGWPKREPPVEAKFNEAIDKLGRAGVRVARRKDDDAVERVETAIMHAMAVTQKINGWEGRWPFNVYRDRDAAKLSPQALARLQAAERMTIDEYRECLAEREHIRATFAVLAERHDVAITLSATGPAPLGIESTGDPAFVVAGSCLGVPVITLPVLVVDGLPLGVQLLGFLDRDETLIAHARWMRDQLAQG